MQPNDGENYWQGDQDEATPPTSQDAPPLQRDNDQPQKNGIQPQEPTISWEASEYIHHERDTLWFVVFGVITLVFLVISIVLVKNYFFTALIIVMAIALTVYVRRPPRVLQYSLTSRGLSVGQQFYPFENFRAFGIIQDGPLFSVRLLPAARFGQALTVYFAEHDGEHIVDIIGDYLPMEDLSLDLIDVILRRLRL